MDKTETRELFNQGREAWNKWANGFQKNGADNPVAVADFSGVQFEEKTDFSEFIFPGKVNFENTLFPKGASFDRAVFAAEASFQYADFRSVVTFYNAEFEQVPDFRFCGFIHVPPFNGTRFPDGRPSGLTENDKIALVPKFQTLKALARRSGQSHHLADFNALEIVARRHVVDQWWHLRFWLGYLYQFFSNFGRSMLRPLFIWLVSIPLFAFAYLSYYQERPQPIVPKDPTNIEGWWNIARNWMSLGQEVSVTGLECEIDKGSLVMKAFYMSTKNAFMNVGGDGHKMAQVQACLYGENTKSKAMGIIPVIPDNVAFLELFQIAGSLLMLGLFLLGFIYQFHRR